MDNSPKRNPFSPVNQNNIFFSSEDSVNTDNSFNSSREEENYEQKNGFKKGIILFINNI